MDSAVTIEKDLPVVVGVDGMPTGLRVVDVAAAEAASRGVPLVVVHAWPGRYGPSHRRRPGVPDRAQGHHLLELAVIRARNAVPDLEVRAELTDESPPEALLAASTRAGLLVVGHRADAGHGWGPTAAYLAHHSACPLMVHRGTTPRRGPVVVAASGVPSVTVGCGFAAAARAGSALVAVHLWDDPESGRGRAAADERLAGAVAPWSSAWSQVPSRRLLIGAVDVPYTVDRAAQRARLVVAGMGHKGWVVEVLYHTGAAGSGRTACPVLLVPPAWPRRRALPRTTEEADARQRERVGHRG
ncbi:universal stress protein [Actinoplanes sp. NBRC 101535]|uniref:universal stress protein n=1 Tax=Actinoplanes sp. NBRC 101535 TaxID=3032196 RepID=UPI0024A1EA37|nr:universal stress protein [Actinoplanes sp. NBRC 101535]GLY02845.1 hypothetical protein Acsp01_32240 [Actinoplanes sp. NBRC 101535]